VFYNDRKNLLRMLRRFQEKAGSKEKNFKKEEVIPLIFIFQRKRR